MKKLAWLVLAVSAALVLAACGGGEEGATVTPPAGAVSSPTALRTGEFGTIVTYSSEDVLDIVAEFAVPEGVSDAPIVILLHQFGGSRQQWRPLIPKLLDQGYAVLAPDLRSLGEVMECPPGPDADRCFDDLLRDVIAAMKYLEARNDVDAARIAVIGASFGGNLAYVASGAFPEVDTAVAMSANASPRGGALLGRNLSDFSPRSVLFMSDEAEADDARALAKNVAEPVDVKVYGGATAHGVQLLDNPQAVQDILDWLRRTL